MIKVQTALLLAEVAKCSVVVAQHKTHMVRLQMRPPSLQAEAAESLAVAGQLKAHMTKAQMESPSISGGRN